MNSLRKLDDSHVECESCGNIFLVLDSKIFFIPPNTQVKLEYPDDDLFRRRENWTLWRKRNYDFYSEQFHQIKSNKNSLLDLGSGRGQFLQLYKDFDIYVGVDFSPYESASVILDLSEELPFHSNSFDVVVASNVLEHLSDSTKIISESFRVIKPGGKFLGTIPFLMPVHQAPHDYVRYTPFGIKLLLESSGFTHVKVYALNSVDESYRYLFQKFWQASIKSNPSIKNRIFFKILNLVNRFFLRLINNSFVDQDFNLGFGFIAIKSD
jgi:SAM-dependent methyltransferase